MGISFQEKREEEKVGDEDDRWGPPVGLIKEKKRKERGGCGLGWSAGLLAPGWPS
jgi:hypothetical protein